MRRGGFHCQFKRAHWVHIHLALLHSACSALFGDGCKNTMTGSLCITLSCTVLDLSLELTMHG